MAEMVNDTDFPQDPGDNWYLIAKKGELTARVRSGMRVGEDELGEMSFIPMDALIEIEVSERGTVLLHPVSSTHEFICGESERTSCVEIGENMRAQVFTPNNVLSIDKDFAATNRVSTTLRVELVAAVAQGDSRVAARPLSDESPTDAAIPAEESPAPKISHPEPLPAETAPAPQHLEEEPPELDEVVEPAPAAEPNRDVSPDPYSEPVDPDVRESTYDGTTGAAPEQEAHGHQATNPEPVMPPQLTVVEEPAAEEPRAEQLQAPDPIESLDAPAMADAELETETIDEAEAAPIAEPVEEPDAEPEAEATDQAEIQEGEQAEELPSAPSPDPAENPALTRIIDQVAQADIPEEERYIGEELPWQRDRRREENRRRLAIAGTIAASMVLAAAVGWFAFSPASEGTDDPGAGPAALAEAFRSDRPDLALLDILSDVLDAEQLPDKRTLEVAVQSLYALRAAYADDPNVLLNVEALTERLATTAKLRLEQGETALAEILLNGKGDADASNFDPQQTATLIAQMTEAARPASDAASTGPGTPANTASTKQNTPAATADASQTSAASKPTPSPEEQQAAPKHRTILVVERSAPPRPTPSRPKPAAEPEPAEPKGEFTSVVPFRKASDEVSNPWTVAKVQPVQIARVQAQAPASAPAAGSSRTNAAGQDMNDEVRRAQAAAIERDLQAAKDAVRNGRLAPPDEPNALTLYQRVLKVDPDNEPARAGLDAVGAALVERAVSLLDAEQPKAALQILDVAETAGAAVDELRAVTNYRWRRVEADTGLFTKLYPAQQLKPLRFEPPDLPRNSRGSSVVVELTVAENGEVTDVELQGNPPQEIARATRRAAQKWQFAPVMEYGLAVPVRSFIRVTFEG